MSAKERFIVVSASSKGDAKIEEFSNYFRHFIRNAFFCQEGVAILALFSKSESSITGNGDKLDVFSLRTLRESLRTLRLKF